MLDVLIWTLILLLGLMVGIAPFLFLVLYKFHKENPTTK